MLKYLTGWPFKRPPGFDPKTYAAENPDIAADGYNLRDHFIHLSPWEGRAPFGLAEQQSGADSGHLAVPPTLSLAPVKARSSSEPIRFDVVIPVHTPMDDVLRCLGSVLNAKTNIGFEIVVIDDAAKDPAVRALLHDLDQRKLITLLSNPTNVGFVASANRGLALHPDRDVILLNADTCVFDGWLDRFARAFDRAPRAGTLTALSNAATILSYPFRLKDNHAALEISFAALDNLIARLDLEPVTIPTAVGFCMGIRRTCLQDIGLFDEKTFGRGYGEENDFSCRAAQRGWHNMAATNVFVWHRGGTSFGSQRTARIADAQKLLEKAHPGYAASIRHFIKNDSLRPIRASIDMERLRLFPAPKVLRVGAPRGVDSHNPAPHPEERAQLASRRIEPEEPALCLHLAEDLRPYRGAYRVFAEEHITTPNLPRIWPHSSQHIIAAMLIQTGINRVIFSDGLKDQRLKQLMRDAAFEANISVQDI